MNVIIACIGSGNMGTALMRGAAKIAGEGNIGFSDVDKSKAEAAAKSIGGKVYDANAQAVEEADYVFLAVKPQVLPDALAEIAPVLNKRALAGCPPVLVSMAAGWSIGKIQALLKTGSGRPAQVVRIMPNTPALISQGVIVMCPSPEVPAPRAAEVENILRAAGLVERMEEKYFDAVTGLSGSGPAFVYLFIEALADGGVRAGLPRDKALGFAAKTAFGAAAMVLETGRHPGELKDMVTSPGGTTIAGVSALENGAFRGTVMNAVWEAYKRSGELG